MTPTLTYVQVSGLIEALAHKEAHQYSYIGFEKEDLIQEIRTECIRVLEFYDPSRIGPSPYQFLKTCIHNKLYNMQRGTFVPNNPPCVRCHLWLKRQKRCKVNEMGCDLIIKYRKNMSTKAAIKQPNSLETDIIDSGYNSDIEAMILDESIKSKLTPVLLKSYQKMLSGKSDQVSDKHKEQIRKIVKNIIKNENN